MPVVASGASQRAWKKFFRYVRRQISLARPGLLAAFWINELQLCQGHAESVKLQSELNQRIDGQDAIADWM